LLGEDSTELYEWEPKVADALRHLPLLTDVNFDQQQGGPEANLIIDRATAARLGLTVGQVDNTLYDDREGARAVVFPAVCGRIALGR
jgi:multidrug efflux pump